jgi:hypothetical protein
LPGEEEFMAPKVNELLHKAREMRAMAENAGSEALSYRMRRQAHNLQRAAEEAGREHDAAELRQRG